MKNLQTKIVVLGSQAVGKTSLVMRYINDTFNNAASPTIGASFFTCNLMIDTYKLRLQIWDTAGQERFRAMAPMYYRNAGVAFLVYDITSQDSYDDIQKWVLELQKNVDGNILVCVLGNKCDLSEQRAVSLSTAEAYATSIGAVHFDTSAVTNQGIAEAFLYVAQAVITQTESEGDNNMSLNSFTTFTGQSPTVKLCTDSELQESDSNSTSDAKKFKVCCGS